MNEPAISPGAMAPAAPTHAEVQHAHADPHRPIYHFLPPANWLNDPNGVTYWNGQYHLFYQYNPAGPFHATIHWGHAASRDLVHWEHLPLALTPTPGSPDADGCWSGCFVDNNGTPTLIYTGMRLEDGVKVQTACLATGDDDLVTWHKYAGNPIIAAPPPELEVVGFRDHSVWREDGMWYQVIGSGIRDVGGTALLYRSPDLITWEYVQPILVGDHRETEPMWTGPMWECPDLFALDGKHVLVVSVWNNGKLFYPVYFVGTYADHTFTPNALHRLDFGPSYYAPQSMRDPQGRRLQWGWLREGRDLPTQEAVDWAGAMSLPRVLTLRPDNTLGVAVAPELQALRDEHYRRTDVNLAPNEARQLGDIRGDALEIVAVFERGDAAEVGIGVRCSPDGDEATYILYDSGRQQVVIDTQRASTAATLHQDIYTAPCALAPDELVTLHIFVDRSVIEVFANERCAGAVRVYPSRPDSDGLHLFARGGSARLVSLDGWALRSIWR
jgi:beta-fructofuranosidase